MQIGIVIFISSEEGIFVGGSVMSIIKRLVMISVVSWVVLIVFVNNIATISDCIWKLMNLFMPVVVVMIGIGLMISAIFK